MFFFGSLRITKKNTRTHYKKNTTNKKQQTKATNKKNNTQPTNKMESANKRKKSHGSVAASVVVENGTTTVLDTVEKDEHVAAAVVVESLAEEFGLPTKSPQSAKSTRPYNKHAHEFDPIIDDLPDAIPRYSLYPLQYPHLHAMYITQVNSFWKAAEINPAADLSDWQQLTEDERRFVSYVLAFFANSDGIVMENLAMRFMNDVKPMEIKFFYAQQIAMEAIHGETYSMLIDTYIPDAETKLKMFRAIEHYDCIKDKAAWAMKYIADNRTQFPSRLVAFVCVEGIFFSSSFCAIFWLKKRGLMLKGLGHSNELIARDEALHCEFAIEVYKQLKRKATKAAVQRIIEEAVEIEIKFVKSAIPSELIGMSSEAMSNYVRFCADRIFMQLGYNSRIYNAQNPFDWMEMISLDGKSNFFEKRVSEYALAPGAFEGGNECSAASASSNSLFGMDVDF